MSLVVDASVALKWVFPEEHSEVALGLLRTEAAAAVPDLFFSEFGNVLWQRVRRGSITAHEAQLAAQSLDALPLALRHYDTRPLLPAALEIACLTGATVYDSMYVALAQREDTWCVTADLKLMGLMGGTPLAERVRWVGDM